MPTILPADPSHVHDAWAIAHRCNAALRALGIGQWPEHYPRRELVERDVDEGKLRVLVDDEGPRGVVTLDETPGRGYDRVPWKTSNPALMVYRLCVDPSAQRRGYASALMGFAEAHAARSGYASIRLGAYDGNPGAVALYRGRGYRDAGTARFDYLPFPVRYFELPLPGGVASGTGS